jgi:Flp pilus assembly secretin CpaC
MTRLYALCCFVIALTVAALAADVQTQDLTLYVGEQQTFTPGYPVGDIQVLNPEVANFKVEAGRRALMLVGKGKGETQLIIWDQKRVKRHEIKLIVRSRDEMKAETDLKELLKEFPTVQVRRLGEKLVVSGTVSSQADLDAIGRIASVASAENLVRFVRGL